MADNIITSFFILIVILIYQTIASFVSLFVPRMFWRKKNIEGQRVLITGAGSGVGRQLAVEFSKHSVCLILVDVNKQGLLQTEKLLDRKSAVFIYECDVSNYTKVYEMAKKVKREAGDVDILVNNAGIVTGKHLQDLPEDRIVKTMEVNVLAHFWTCKAFLPAMMKKNSGHLVSIISLAGKAGCPRLTDYSASKFAAVGFVESLECELREQNLYGIKLTAVCPALINTGLFQGAFMKNVGTILSPEYVAKEVVLGVLEEREIIYVPHFLQYLVAFKEFFPRWLVIKCHEITGNLKGMEKFTGRQPNDVPSADKPKKSE